MRPAPRRERPVHQARGAPPSHSGPARRALAGLVLAFLALLGGAGSALAQSCPEPTDLWCATMTVGYVNNEEYAGYDADGPGAVYLGLDGGTLEPDRFVHDGVEYTIDFLYNSTTDSPLTEDTSRPLALGISPALPVEARDGLVLHLDTEALALSAAVDGGEFESGLVWLGTARKSLNVAVAEGLWPYFSTVAVRLAAAVTVPDAPIGLAADVEAGAVTLTWIRPSDGGAALGEYEYRVSADGGTTWSPDWSAIAGSGADTVAHEVTGLTSDTPYTFEVRAVNGEGAGPAARVDATPHAPRAPDAPGDLGAIPGAGAVTLTWTPPYSGNGPLTGYEYRASADGGTTWSPDWSTIPGGGPGTVAHEVTRLTDDTPYTFEVRAVNGRGEGPAARTTATPSASAVAPAVTVSFGAASYRAFEGELGLPATVEVRLSETPGREVEVALTATGAGGATADDWNAPASVTFAATETSKTFELTAGDAPGVYGYDPGESVALVFGDLPEGVAPGAPATATVHLHNDEKVPVEFYLEVPDDLRISESGGEITIVGRTLGNERPDNNYINIRITDVEGDGDTSGFHDNLVTTPVSEGDRRVRRESYQEEGGIYVARQPVYFEGGTHADGLTVEDDEDDENDEIFTLEWKIKGSIRDVGPNRRYRYAGDQSFRMTLVEDDFAPVVGATEFDFAALPGATEVATLEATDGDLEDAMGGALAWTIQGGGDGSLFNLTAAGVLSFKTTPDPANPGDADTDGVYELRVQVTDGYNPVEADIVVRLLPGVTIAADESTVDENAGDAGFTLTRSATGTALAVTVEVTQQADRDLLPDGAAMQRTVTFAADSATATLAVTLENDDLLEADGVLTVAVQPGTGYAVGAAGSATVNVVDTDAGLPAPANLRATPGTAAGEVVLAWDPHAPHLRFSGHQYRYRIVGDGGGDWPDAWTDIPDSGQHDSLGGDGSNLAGYTVTGLVGGQAHAFQVRTFAPDDRVADPSEQTATPRPVTVSFGAATYPVDEGATVVVTVRLDGPPGRRVVVPISAVGMGGATPQGETGADWSGVPPDATFSATAASTSFTLTAIADTALDHGEGLTLSLEPLPAGVEAGSPSRATVAIGDDDTPMVTIEALASPVKEGTDAEFTLTRNPAGPELAVTVSLTESGDVISPAATSTSTVAFAAGAATARLAVATVADAAAEDDSLVTATVDAGTGYVAGSPSSAAVVVADDDGAPPALRFTLSTVAIEDSGHARVFLALDRPRLAPIVVHWETGDASPVTAVAGVDYEASSGTVTFAAGETEKEVRVAMIDDDRVENAEKFLVSLRPADDTLVSLVTSAGDCPSGELYCASPRTYTIVDTDEATLSIDVETAVDEGAGSVTITVAIGPGAVDFEFEYDYETAPGIVVPDRAPGYAQGYAQEAAGLTYAPASAGADYPHTTGTLTFRPGAPRQTITVPIIDDATDEERELFQVWLVRPREVDRRVLRPDRPGRVVIDDDDPPALRVADAYADEGDPVTFTVALSPPSERTVTVDWEASVAGGDTAEAADLPDLASARGTLTFAAGETVGRITVPTAGDADADHETFTVTLSSPSNATIPEATATGTIEDDAVPMVTIEAVASPVTEGADAEFTLTRSATGTAALEVTVLVTESAGMLSDPVPGRASFGADATTTTLAVSTSADEVVEDDSVVTAALRLGTGYNVGTPASATVTVEDDDVATVGFGASRYDVTEGASVAVAVEIDLDTDRALTIELLRSDGAGASDADLTGAPRSVTIGPSSTTTSFTVAAAADGTDEDDGETVTFSFGALPDGVRVAAGGATSTARVVVADNDPPASLSVEDARAEEGRDVTFEVTLSPASGKTVTVDVGTSIAGTDTAAATDFTATTTTLTFTPGQTEKTVTVSTEEDENDEANETFTLTLSSPTNATIADATATGTIDDDDRPVMGFTSDDKFIVEEKKEIQFEVKLDREGHAPITVDWETVESGSAEADVDYVAATGALTFAPGETEKTIAVGIVDDDILEGLETFDVRLSGTDDALVTLAQSSITARIIDWDMATISVAEETTVDEGVGTVTLTLTASATGTIAYVFDYRTADGTAEAGADYTAKSGRVRIPAGTTEGTITIAVLEDTADEDREDFEVQLVAHTEDTDRRLTLGGPARVLIEDNDPEPVLSVADARANEGDLLTFTVALLPASGRTVTVDWATSVETGDTATSGTDFTLATGTLTFMAGDTEETITVRTTPDATVEENETFSLTLSGPGNATLADGGTTLRAAGTIVNDDLLEVTVSFGAASYDADEGDPGTPATVEVRLSAAPGREVEVPLTAAGADGATADDWSGVPATVTFSATATSTTFEVAAGDAPDGYDWDPGESVVLGFGALLPEGVAAAAPETATVVLHNDEKVPIEFYLEVPEDLRISEGGGEVALVARTLGNEAPDDGVFFNIKIGDIRGDANENIKPTKAGTGTFLLGKTGFSQEGEIYAGRKTVAFTPGATATGGLGIENDEDAEDTERFTLSWSLKSVGNTGPDYRYRELDPKSFRMYLVEDDFAPVVGATAFDFETVPGVTQVATLEATDGDLEDAVGGALAWTIRGGTDRGLFDLTPAGVLSFKAAPDAANPGDADADGVYELQVRVTDGYNPVDADIEVRVVVPAPKLSVAGAEGAEDEGVEFTVTLSETSTEAVTATWTASIESGDTAVAADLTATTTDMVTVAAGATTTTFTVPVANDTTDEDDQTFTVTLSGVSSNALLGAATAKGTIEDDDDPPTVGIGDNEGNEDGAGDSIDPVVRLSAESEKTVTVTWTASIESGDTAQAADFVDLSAATGTVTILPGSDVQAIFQIQPEVFDDALDEKRETFTVTLSDPVNAVVGQVRPNVDSAGTITILDDDPMPTVTVAGATATEGAPVAFVVTLSAVSGRDVTVDYATSVATGDDATSGTDFTSTSGTLTIAAADSTATGTIEVPTLPDDDEESAETFTLTISNPNNATLGTPSAATGTIDDGTLPALSVADAEGAEDVGVEFTVTLSKAVPQDVTVDWTASIEGVDSAAEADLTGDTTGTVTIAANATTMTFTVAAADTTDEPDQTFTVTLSNPTPTSLAQLAADPTARGTIEDDDDPPTVGITDSAGNEHDAGDSIFPTVQLSAASEKTVTVTWTASIESGDTAQAADFVDLSAATGTVTVLPGSDVQAFSQIQPEVFDDALDEADETFTVTLSDPVNAVVGQVNDSVDAAGTMTIVDDDPTPTVTVADATATEGGAVAFVVTLSAVSGRDVTVDYATSVATGDDATSGTDFTPASGTLTIAAADGTATGTIEVETTADDDDEGAETFTLTLSNPMNVTLGTPSAATGRIVDEAALPEVTIAPGASPVTEGTAAAFTLTRTAPGTALTVAVSVTEDGDVISGTAPVEVAFAEGAATATLEVATEADTAAETSSVVTATVAAGTGYRVGTPATAAVTVHDDDRQELTVGFFTSLTRSFLEQGGATAEIVLGFDPVPDRSVTIPVVRTDGPGAGAGDLSGDPGSVTLDPAFGATNTSFTITVIDDDVAEHDESVFFAIGEPLPDGVRVDPARSRSRVRILDNDGTPADNRAPEITTTTTVFEIAENSPRVTAIGEAIEATDADIDELRFDLRGTDGDNFRIKAVTDVSGDVSGQIRAFAALDHEAKPSHSVRVRVKDEYGGVDTLDVTINVTDVDEPPSAPAAPAVKPTRGSGTSLDVSWEAPANAGKPAIESYDLRYREEGGSWEDGPRDVTATTTAMIAGLTDGADYEVQVRATNDEGDGPWSESASGRPGLLVVKVRFGQGPDAPYEVDEGGTVDVVVELGEAPGRAVTIGLARDDGDGGATAADLTGDPASVTIGADETRASFTVAAADDDLDEDDETVTFAFGTLSDGVEPDSEAATTTAVLIRDDDSSPVFAATSTTLRVAENSAADTAVGAPVTATDADAGDTVEHSLEGTDADAFAIDGATGQISTGAAPLDHEAKPSYAVTVKAGDGHGNTATTPVTIEVTDVPEPPPAPGAPAVTAPADATDRLDVGWKAPENAGRPAIESYDLRYREFESADEWTDGPQDVAAAATATTTAMIVGLTDGTSYEVQVRATNDEGDGEWSESGSGRTVALPEVTVAAVDSTVSERDDAQFTLTRNATGTALTVAVSVTETGDVISGTPPSTVAFAAAAATATLVVELDDDAVYEDESVVTVTVGAGDGYKAGDPASAAVTVLSDEPRVVVGFGQARHDVDEGDSVEVTVALDKDAGRELTIPVVRTNGTGADAADLTGAPSSVTIGAGATSTSFTVTAADDDEHEAEETVTFSFGTLPDGVEVESGSATTTAAVVIADDDTPVVTIAADRDAFISRIDDVSFTLTRTGDPSGALTVGVTLEPGTLAEDDVLLGDGELARSVTFEANATTVSLTVQGYLFSDHYGGQDTTLTATVDAGTGYVPGTPAEASVTIIATRAVTVHIEETAYTFAEDATGDAATMHLVARTEPGVPVPNGLFQVSLNLQSGEARSGDDFEHFSEQVSIEPSDFGAQGSVYTARKAVALSLIDDTVHELTETATLFLQRTPGQPDWIVNLHPNGTTVCPVTGCTSTVTITDDDPPPVVTIAAATSPVTEGTAAAFTLTRSATGTVLTVNVTVTEDGDVISGTTSSTVTFATATTTTATLEVATENDTTVETSSVVTATVGAGMLYTVGTPASAAVTVHDDDREVVTVGFGQASYEVDEGATVEVTVALDRWPVRPVTIPVVRTDGTGATAADLTGAPANVTIGANERSASFTVTAADDALIEDDETVTFSFGEELPDGVRVVSGSATTTAEVVITDDDEAPPDTPVVTIAAGASPVTEGTAAEFTLTRTAPGMELTVTVAVTEDGDVISGTATSTTVAFAEGAATATLTVATEDDAADETDSVVTATVAAGTGYAVGSPEFATVTVQDDDLPVVTIATPSPISTEEQGADFTLTRIGPTTAALTVTVEVTQEEDRDLLPDGAATSTTVTFAVGASTATLAVELENDTLRELSGDLTVEVQAGAGYTVGSPSSAVVDVRDADQGAPLTPQELTAEAGSGVGEVVLSWTEPAAHLQYDGHQYRYKTDGAYGSWTNIPDSGRETAGDGANLAGWTVPGLTGGQEHTFQVRANYDYGTPSVDVFSAASNEAMATPLRAAVSFGAASYSVDEGATVVVTVSLSGAPGREVTVPVSAAGGGGATAPGETGADWSGVPENVTFGATDTDQTFTLAATRDTVDDDGETVVLTFGTLPPGVTKGTVSEATVTIVDDDAPADTPVVTIAAGASPVTEGTAAEFTLTRTATGTALTVTVAVTETGDVISGTATSTTVAFAAAAATATLTVATEDDTADEADSVVTATVAAGAGYAVGSPGSATVTVQDDDDTAPTIDDVDITSMPVLETDTYGAGETIEVSVTFDEAVTATSDTDFVLSVAGAKRAPLVRGSGTATLVFGYTVVSSDEDDDGIWIGDQDRTLVGNRNGDPQNGTITSLATSTAADLTHSELGQQSDHKVDGSRSIVSVAVSSTPMLETDTYGAGEKIRFKVTFNLAVDVSGDPVLAFALGNQGDVRDVDAAYETGTGTTALVFAYTVVSTDADNNGIFLKDEDDFNNPDGPVRLDSDDTIRFTGTSTDVPLYWQGRGTQSGHKVDGSRTTGNNAPVFTSSASLSVEENTLTATVVAVDNDSDDDITGYAITGGTDQAFFSEVTSAGVLTFNEAPNFEDPKDSGTDNTYVVTVEATSGTGTREMTATQTITVTVTDDDTEQSAKPAKPTLEKVTGSSTTLTATWAEPDLNGGPDIAGYDVEYREGTTGMWEGFAHSGTATTTTITGLMASTFYQARVLARNGETPSDWSDASDAISTNAATPGTTPTLSIADAEGNEAAGVVEFTVTLSATTTADVTATWTASIGGDDTAVAADLGATKTGPVSVMANATTTTFTVPVANDATDEADETFTVTLSGVSSNAQLAADPTAEGTIKDNDDLPSLRMGDGGTDEDGVQAVVMAVTPASGREVMVTWTVSIESGNTTEPADFTDLSAATGTVTIPAGRTSYTFSLVGVVADDSLDENDETYTVTLSDPVNATLSSNKAGTVTIKDDDPLPELSVEDVTAEEGGGLTFTVALDPVSGRTVEVDWATSVETDDNATSDTDFTATSSTLTFMPGDERKTFTVMTIEDTTEEPDETFTVTLSSASNATISATDATATGTITDDDAVVTTPTLGIADAEGNEATGVAFTVTLSAPSTQAVTATWTASIGSGDTAVAADLGATKTGPVSVMANATTTTFTVPVANDATDEADETFTVTLSNVSTNAQLATDATATGRIEDDDPEPTVSVADVTAAEGDVLTFTVTLDPVSGRTVTVAWAASVESGDTATSGTDFTADSGTLTFNPGDVRVFATVPTIDDSTIEDDETFTVTLSNAMNAGISDATATGTIENDDGTVTKPTLSIADAAGDEGAGVEFTVTLSATSTQAVTATWTASIGSADTAVAADLTATTTDMVTVAAGDTTAKFTVPVADDATDEDDEYFTVTLSGVSSNAQLGRATARGTINDDDDLPSLRMGDGGTDEDGVQAVVMAVTPASGREVMVTWTVSIESGNTTEPADFTDLSAATGTVTIPAGRTSYTFSLVGVVADDSLDENDETYTVTLSDPVNATLSSNKAGTVTIKDDDPLPELSVEDVTAEEGGGLTFTVTLDPVSGRTVEVDWATSVETDDNATSDMDFTAASSTLTFMPGDERKTFTVMTIEDTTEEPDETFTVTLSSASNATISATDATATGTITDDDAVVTTPTLGIADAEGNEAAGVAFTVTLSAPSTQAVTATWTASIGSGDTAVAADLGATKTGTVTVAMNATTTTFTVPVANDATDEADETFTVTLSNASNATLSNGQTTLEVIGTIEDDDTRGVTVSKTEFTFREGREATYEVVLDTQPTGPLTVRVTVSGSPEVTAQPSSLWFTANDWSQPQSVTVRAAHDDDTVDDEATVTHAVAGADYGSNEVTAAPVSVSVEDDDTPLVTVSETAIEFREGGSATYTVMLDTQPSGTVTVTPSVRSVAGVTVSPSSLRFTPSVRGVPDVTVSPSQLTFTAQNWDLAQTVTVEAADDNDTATHATVTVEHEVTGADYDDVTVPVPSVVVTVNDDEAASTKVTLAVSPRTVREDAGATSLTVTAELDGAATTTATVVMLAAATSTDFEVRVDATPLTIPAGAVRATARMTLTPRDDDVDGPVETKTVTVSGTTTASLRVTEAEVTIVDDDTRALVVLVSPRTVPPTVLIGRNGEATYTVRLATRPRGGEDVMVSADLSAPPGVTVAPDAPLRFTADDWSEPQTVTVAVAPGTAYRDGETAAVVHEVSGTDYGSVPGGEVVVLLDPDAKLPREPGERLAPTAQEATQGWIARFGRTVTAQVLEAIEARLRARRAAGMRATLAGQALPAGDAGVGANDNASDRVPRADARDREAMATIGDLVAHAGAGPGSGAGAGAWRGDGDGPGGRVQSRALTGRDFVTGTSFELTGGSPEAGGSAALWGRGAISRFDGREGDLTLDGEVTTGLMGADWASAPGSGAGRWTAGLAVGHARGTGSYTEGDNCTGGDGDGSNPGASDGNDGGASDDGDGDGNDPGASGCAGEVESTLTGLWPYGGLKLTDRLSISAAAGYGTGELRLMPAGNTGPFTADLTMAMGAAGLRGEVLAPPPEGGLALAVKGDTRFTRTRSKATKDARGGPLKAATGDVWLLRLGVEGSRRFALGADGAGTTLTPRFEVGARLDGGDAETGLGVDLGAGVTLAAPRHGLMLVLNARGLLAHEASGLRESGASASLAWDPRPTTDRGLALTLRQGWGGSPAGGMNALLGRETLAGLAADPGLGAGAGDNGGTASAGRLEAELGYGIALFGGGFTGTPNIGIGLSDTARDYRLGWRLTSARKGAAGFELGLDATRREAAGDDAEHGLAVRLSIRW